MVPWLAGGGVGHRRIVSSIEGSAWTARGRQTPAVL